MFKCIHSTRTPRLQTVLDPTPTWGITSYKLIRSKPSCSTAKTFCTSKPPNHHSWCSDLCCSDLMDKFLVVIGLGRIPSGSKLPATSCRHLKSRVSVKLHLWELIAQNLPLWAKMLICFYRHSNCSASLVFRCSSAMTVPTKTKWYANRIWKFTESEQNLSHFKN